MTTKKMRKFTLGGLPALITTGTAAVGKETRSFFDTVFDKFAAGVGGPGVFSKAGGKKSGQEDENDVDAIKRKDAKFAERLERHAKYGGQRLLDVFNAVVVPVAPDFVAPIYLKSKEETEFLEGALKGSLVFENLRRHEKSMFLKAFEKKEFDPDGAVVLKQGEQVRHFYIIQTGKVLAHDEDETTTSINGREFGPGDFLGELALLYDYPCEATFKTNRTAEADEKYVLWCLDQVTFKKALIAYGLRHGADTTALLRKVTLFKGLDTNTLTAVAAACTSTTYNKGDTVLKKGEPFKAFCIIKEGSVIATDLTIGGSQYDNLTFNKPGDAFGEGAILKNLDVMANVTAAEDNTTILTMPRDVFIKMFGGMEALIQRSSDKKRLVGVVTMNFRIDFVVKIIARMPLSGNSPPISPDPTSIFVYTDSDQCQWKAKRNRSSTTTTSRYWHRSSKTTNTRKGRSLSRKA